MTGRKYTVPIHEDLLAQVRDFQHAAGIGSREKAVAALVEKGLLLAGAEAGGFDLVPILKQQVADDMAALERGIEEREGAGG